ncbi:MAG: long-chain-acyl-CoA synthetase [Pseudomonadota bacterium]|nr:long-chain-acyl-CoA synthetase [Pseudomonadota bacterium]
MSQANHQDVITLTDIAKRAPMLLKKLPHVVKGLILANDTRKTKAMGLGWAFEKSVRANPYGIALLYQDTQLTYVQFNEWINQLAHYFLAQGLKKGDVAAVFIENRPELLALAVAFAKIGVTTALVNTSQTGKVLTHSINLVKPKVVIVGEELVAPIDEVLGDLEINSKQLYWFADQDTQKDSGKAPAGYTNLGELIHSYPRFNPPTTDSVFYADGLFYIYTSGTTGLPKAVIFNHGRWMKAYGTLGHIIDLKDDDIMYVTLPFYHATAMVACWSAVLAGNSGIAIRRKFSASQFWSDVRRFDATSIAYVGELCRYLMETPAADTDRQHRVTKMMGNGLRPNIWGKFKNRFGIEEVYELYASSEGNVGFSNIFNFENTVGFSPLPYAIVKYDKELDQPIRDDNGFMIKVGKGESGLLIGEITKRSPFDGYTDPEKSKASIFQDVFEKGDQYFNTGDLVRDIGFRHAQFVDRLGDTFRWKGENVSTTEVENIVADHPKVAEAVVYGVEIPNTNGRAGMCAITPHEGDQITAEDYADLCAFLNKQLPSYAVPVFIRIQAQMETTGTFKYQKNNLKKQGFDPAQTDEPLLVCLPSTASYTEITAEVFENIQQGKYRF